MFCGCCRGTTGKTNALISVVALFGFEYLIRKRENLFPHLQNGTPNKAAILEIRQQRRRLKVKETKLIALKDEKSKRNKKRLSKNHVFI